LFYTEEKGKLRRFEQYKMNFKFDLGDTN